MMNLFELPTHDFSRIANPFDAPLPRRRFGRTELMLPVLSTGSMRYQDGWEDKPLSDVAREAHQNLISCIQKSLAIGMNHIETARGYGVSERQLGTILKTVPREFLIVQTKVAPTEDPKEFEQHLNESFERLQVNKLDLFAMHGINTPQLLEWCMRPGGCMEVAKRFQKEGRIGHIGFSSHGDSDLVEAAVTDDRFGGFDYVNLHWYFIYQVNSRAIDAARKRDMGVFIISPTDKGGMLFKPTTQWITCCQPLHPIVFNDRFCLEDDRVHTISVGASAPTDYDLHLEAANSLYHPELPIAPIAAKLSAVLKENTGYDTPTALTHLLPKSESAPGKLALNTMHWLYILWKGLGMTEYATMRLNLLGNADHWFPGASWQTLAATDQSALLDALANCPEPAKVLAELRQLTDAIGADQLTRLSKS